MRLDTLGTKQDDCVVDECRKIACYEPCEHRSIVYSKLPARPYQSQEFLSNLIDSILETQEDLIRRFCEPLDICELGFRLGFPCVQCGLSEYEQGESVLNLCGVTCICAAPVQGKDPSWVDLSSPEYIDFYAKAVNWLNCQRGHANGEAVTSFAEMIGGYLMGASNGAYSISMPSDPLMLAILPILESIVPVPFGASVKFYMEQCD